MGIDERMNRKKKAWGGGGGVDDDDGGLWTNIDRHVGSMGYERDEIKSACDFRLVGLLGTIESVRREDGIWMHGGTCMRSATMASDLASGG